MKKIIIFIIHSYSVLISPYIPTQCRFYPTCSHYMMEAIERKGILRGLWSGLGRIIRCNPFCHGGYDPVK